jgi:hypothetical protein
MTSSFIKMLLKVFSSYIICLIIFRFAQGGDAFFEGKVNGNPTPQVVWTRKGLQMKGKETKEPRKCYNKIH